MKGAAYLWSDWQVEEVGDAKLLHHLFARAAAKRKVPLAFLRVKVLHVLHHSHTRHLRRMNVGFRLQVYGNTGACAWAFSKLKVAASYRTCDCNCFRAEPHSRLGSLAQYDGCAG